MNYRVVWLPNAEDELAAVWLAAADQDEVARAAHVVEGELARRPLQTGFPRSSSVHRFAWQLPIGVEFEVVEDDKRVFVLGVFAAT